MDLTGRRIGSYQVETQIGAGAMGKVYRARDTRLGRDVALKVLPTEFAADPSRLSRFEREARLLAALNHPRIATIHGFEETDGVRALVLELVEGPTLAERIARGPMPVGEAITLGSQIAEALEAAHAKGIIHRDLKPANIKVLPGGAVKVLDFGLAKALAGDESGSDVSHLPTVTATQVTGLIAGTPAYMSPEQARGDQVDRQTDIWALGCVLYEMVAGRMVFAGKTLSDTLAAVLEHEPDWSALPPSTPAKLRGLLKRCLQKDRRRRLRDAGDAVNELVDLLSSTSDDAEMARPAAGSRRTGILVVGASILSAVVTGAVLWTVRPPSAAAPVRARSVQFIVGADGPEALQPSGLDRDLAISPDGSRVVYVAGGPGRIRLVARALGELDTTRLWDLDTPRAPFFSPDGRWLGFFGLFGNLKKISMDGGPGSEISRGVSGASRGASWAPDGHIVFATSDPGTGLLRVAEGGGEAEVLTKPERARGELDHFWPEVLPGGRAVLFTITSPGSIDTAQIALLNLETRTTKILLRGGAGAQYVSGYLIYGGGGSLHAVPFDLERGEVTGDPVKVVDRVAITADGAVNATVSQDGTLAYVRPRTGGALRTLVWVNRDGRETSIGAPPRPYTYPRLSPDGTRVALEVWDENRDIWVWDLARETLTRLTDTPGRDGFPVWTPDGARLIFGSTRGGTTNLYSRAATGTGQVERVTESPQIQFPYSMSRSGANLLVREEHADTGLDISVVAINGERKATTLLRTAYNELNAEISPDGRWFAYQSNESGQDEVYVRPFPETGDDRQQVSTNGGTRPVWARDGRELFYLAPDGLFGVTVSSGPGFKLGSPHRLIDRRYFAETAFLGRTYDVSPDGQRFLMIKDDADDGGRPAIVVVENWLEQLKAQGRRP